MTGDKQIIKTGDIHLDGLTKPATVLVEKICNAMGASFVGLCRPYQIKRVAKAEGEAAIIKIESDIKIEDLKRRAEERWLCEEAIRQANIESITCKSFSHLDENATPQKIEDDWITYFFDKSRLVSDEEMQDIWARILAGQANAPGKFSKRTIDCMASLEKTDAERFTKLCSFSLVLETDPLIYDLEHHIYKENDITFITLNHLESIGLINFNSLVGYGRTDIPKEFSFVTDNGKSFRFKTSKEKNITLGLGKVFFTNIGQEIASICTPESVPGFEEYVIEQWKKQGFEVEVSPTSSPAQ